ncbi:NAD-dependent epimerase/dehydratase family protein [Citricoccus nitrophenolicus]|uniref:polysaccharide biosynthesis C-terminal domain-containing protein n=1 Tax=Citricoccus nitrophenolicus TaxID=863575 RepID=UPI0031F1A403
MTKIAITGAGGFLGLHLRAAALESGFEVAAIPLGDRFDAVQAQESVEGASRLIHLAGVNRGNEEDVANGNARFASQLASVLKSCEDAPTEVVFANSIQAGNGTVYGTAKEGAAGTLGTAADQAGATFSDVRLPNLFGEYGQPFYNSVVATFSHMIAQGEAPEVQQDKELQLLHAQNAADVLLGTVPETGLESLSRRETVSRVKGLLEEFAQYYSAGEFPDLSTAFRRDLFNTYRAYTFPDSAPINVTRHADQRGSFSEIVRSRGGTGQTSFSTTQPGITRGDHYHRRKVERFTVLAGEAEIGLRRLFDDRVFTFRATGEEPKSVDMPTLYAHNIRNVGADTLYTAFWTNDIFDPTNPDTIPETV